jgi:hypothetical protein
MIFLCGNPLALARSGLPVTRTGSENVLKDLEHVRYGRFPVQAPSEKVERSRAHGSIPIGV